MKLLFYQSEYNSKNIIDNFYNYMKDNIQNTASDLQNHLTNTYNDLQLHFDLKMYYAYKDILNVVKDVDKSID